MAGILDAEFDLEFERNKVEGDTPLVELVTWNRLGYVEADIIDWNLELLSISGDPSGDANFGAIEGVDFNYSYRVLDYGLEITLEALEDDNFIIEEDQLASFRLQGFVCYNWPFGAVPDDQNAYIDQGFITINFTVEEAGFTNDAETVDLNSSEATLQTIRDNYGSKGGDDIVTLHNDISGQEFDAGAGADQITGGTNDDSIIGGLGSDSIFGGEGNDTIDGGADNDSIEGGNGDDSITGGAGHDTITGGEGADTIDGGNGADTINVTEADIVEFEGSPQDYCVTVRSADAGYLVQKISADGTPIGDIDTINGASSLKFGSVSYTYQQLKHGAFSTEQIATLTSNYADALAKSERYDQLIETLKEGQRKTSQDIENENSEARAQGFMDSIAVLVPGADIAIKLYKGDYFGGTQSAASLAAVEGLKSALKVSAEELAEEATEQLLNQQAFEYLGFPPSSNSLFSINAAKNAGFQLLTKTMKVIDVGTVLIIQAATEADVYQNNVLANELFQQAEDALSDAEQRRVTIQESTEKLLFELQEALQKENNFPFIKHEDQTISPGSAALEYDQIEDELDARFEEVSLEDMVRNFALAQFENDTDSDSIDLAPGKAGLVAGTAAMLNNASISNFGSDDRLELQGSTFDDRSLTVTQGSAILDIDIDLDGETDTRITLEGDFSSGEFVVTNNGVDTTITYASDDRNVILGDDDDNFIFADDFELRYALPEANQVFRLYQATFNRVPDEGGHKRWTSELFTGESTLADVREGFVGSQEFRNKYANVDDATFVKQMYINVLDRDFDQGEVTQAEIESWTGRITDSFTRADVVNGFAESQQLINNTLQAANALAVNSNPASWSDDVYRLYQATLDRAPDLGGFQSWSESLADGRPLTDVISGFTNSQEFANTYGTLTDPEDFVKLLYNNVLGRDFDVGEVAQSEIAGWTSQLNDTFTRANIVQGFSQSLEFTNKTSQSLKDWVRAQGVDDQINGAAGTNILAGGSMSDQFVFSQADSATNTVVDLETWDYMSFDGFGYSSEAEARGHMVQSGSSVVFSDQGTEVTFERFQLSNVTDDMILI